MSELIWCQVGRSTVEVIFMVRRWN